MYPTPDGILMTPDETLLSVAATRGNLIVAYAFSPIN